MKVEVEKFKKSAQQAGRAFGSRKSVSKRKSVAKKQGSEGKMTMRAPRAPKRSMVANGANSPRQTKRGMDRAIAISLLKDRHGACARSLAGARLPGRDCRRTPRAAPYERLRYAENGGAA